MLAVIILFAISLTQAVAQQGTNSSNLTTPSPTHTPSASVARPGPFLPQWESVRTPVLNDRTRATGSLTSPVPSGLSPEEKVAIVVIAAVIVYFLVRRFA